MRSQVVHTRIASQQSSTTAVHDCHTGLEEVHSFATFELDQVRINRAAAAEVAKCAMSSNIPNLRTSEIEPLFVITPVGLPTGAGKVVVIVTIGSGVGVEGMLVASDVELVDEDVETAGIVGNMVEEIFTQII